MVWSAVSWAYQDLLSSSKLAQMVENLRVHDHQATDQGAALFGALATPWTPTYVGVAFTGVTALYREQGKWVEGIFIGTYAGFSAGWTISAPVAGANRGGIGIAVGTAYLNQNPGTEYGGSLYLLAGGLLFGAASAGRWTNNNPAVPSATATLGFTFRYERT